MRLDAHSISAEGTLVGGGSRTMCPRPPLSRRESRSFVAFVGFLPFKATSHTTQSFTDINLALSHGPLADKKNCRAVWIVRTAVDLVSVGLVSYLSLTDRVRLRKRLLSAWFVSDRAFNSFVTIFVEETCKMATHLSGRSCLPQWHIPPHPRATRRVTQAHGA